MLLVFREAAYRRQTLEQVGRMPVLSSPIMARLCLSANRKGPALGGAFSEPKPLETCYRPVSGLPSRLGLASPIPENKRNVGPALVIFKLSVSTNYLKPLSESPAQHEHLAAPQPSHPA